MFKDIYSISYQARRLLHKRISAVLASIFLVLSLIFVIQTFVIFPVSSKSDAMSPDIPENGCVFVSRLPSAVRRGDVFLVSSPKKVEFSFAEKALDFFQRFLTAQRCSLVTEKKGGGPYLRRVVALPGDTIYINNYVVYVKNSSLPQFLTEFELSDASYNLSLPAVADGLDIRLGAAGNMETVTLGKDEYFLLADNRQECVDSRIWGPVTKDSLCGKAALVYFPLNKFKIL